MPVVAPLQSSLTLRQLRIFSAVARHLGFSRAARELLITQPTVSYEIAQLERVLQAQLFLRTKRDVALTSEGKALYERARRILDLVDETESALRELHVLERGTLTLGADPTVGTYVMPAVLGAFKTRFPGVEVRLEVQNRQLALERLLEHRYDTAVLIGPFEQQELVTTPLLSHEVVVIAAPDHPLTRRRRISLARLSEEPFILREAGSGIRDALERTMRQASLPLRVDLELGNNESVKQAVAHGLGIGVMSRMAIANELALRQLGVLDAAGFPIVLPWHLVVHRMARTSRLVTTFARFLQEEVARVIPLTANQPARRTPLPRARSRVRR